MRKASWIRRLLVAAIAFNLNVVAGAHEEAEPPVDREVVIGVGDVFVPKDLDRDAEIKVVVSGIFSNGCYRWNRAEVEHDGALHRVRVVATVREGMCLMVLVPFSREVVIGKLGAGDHTLRFIGGDGTYLEKRLSLE